MWVRIISYRITDERLGEVGQVYRLVTTLLNPRVAPALELVALYHERWEIELVIDEIKTHERAQRKVLRSKTPEGVRQELYGMYLAHYTVRALMAQAAVESDLDPDRLSFPEGLFELTEMISLALTLEPEDPRHTQRGKSKQAIEKNDDKSLKCKREKWDGNEIDRQLSIVKSHWTEHIRKKMQAAFLSAYAAVTTSNRKT
jgi:hypothetical protein